MWSGTLVHDKEAPGTVFGRLLGAIAAQARRAPNFSIPHRRFHANCEAPRGPERGTGGLLTREAIDVGEAGYRRRERFVVCGSATFPSRSRAWIVWSRYGSWTAS